MDFSNKVYEALEHLETNRQTLKNYYAELGEKYYTRHAENVPNEYTEEFLEIQKIVAVNREIEEWIDREIQVKTCPACGEKIPSEAVYCPYCRTSVIELKAANDSASSNETAICMKCGHQNRPGSRFCSHCGNPLE